MINQGNKYYIFISIFGNRIINWHASSMLHYTCFMHTCFTIHVMSILSVKLLENKIYRLVTLKFRNGELSLNLIDRYSIHNALVYSLPYCMCFITDVFDITKIFDFPLFEINFDQWNSSLIALVIVLDYWPRNLVQSRTRSRKIFLVSIRSLDK